MKKTRSDKLILTEMELKRLVDARNAGTLLADLGKRFGVSTGTIAEKLREAKEIGFNVNSYPKGRRW